MSSSSSAAAYAPGPVPGDAKQLPAYLTAELQKIAGVVRLLAAGHIDPSHAAPPKPRDGDIRLADGTDWDPGAGAGVYAFYSAAPATPPAWHKLG